MALNVKAEVAAAMAVRTSNFMKKAPGLKDDTKQLCAVAGRHCEQVDG
jgi:hypothetical protein